MTCAWYPGDPFSTTNALTCPSSVLRAQTTIRSATVPSPIHRLRPFSTQPSPSRRAEVSRATESDPWSGSVSANAPSLSIRAMSGSQRAFCSSEPHIAIEVMARPACTPRNDAQAAVAAVQLHRDQPGRHRAHPGAPVALDVLPDDAQLGQPPDQRPRDLRPFPVPADDRHHLLVDELPDGGEVRPLLVGELLAYGEEVRPERLPEMGAHGLCHCRFPSWVRSVSRNASTTGARRSAPTPSSRWPPW